MDNTLTVVSWQRLKLSGVKTVLAFDEEYVSLDTELGRINIEGKELKIESLSKESSDIEIIGNITGVFNLGEKKSPLSKRLFK